MYKNEGRGRGAEIHYWENPSISTEFMYSRMHHGVHRLFLCCGPGVDIEEMREGRVDLEEMRDEL